MTFVETSILKPADRKIIEENHDRLIDYLIKYHTYGFETYCSVTVNSKKIEIENYDIELSENDIIVLVHHQGVTAAMFTGLNAFWGFIAAAAANMAISFVLSKIFAPKTPASQSAESTRNNGQASSVYSLNSQQNEAKRGEPIPIIYGKVRTYPALIAPPYYRFENNEEYLYQLMCIGHGKFNFDKLMISDTDSAAIQTDYFRYEKLEYDDFKTPALLDAKVDDSNYNQLVKAIPDVDNLELRGTPQNKSMVMRFENDTITFYPYANGDTPDLSSLSTGSTITISNAISNNGVYIVDSVLDNVVTIQAHTFVLEPTDSTSINVLDDAIYPYDYFKNLHILGNTLQIEADYPGAEYTLFYDCSLIVNSILEFTNTTLNNGIEFQVKSNSNSKTYISESLTTETISNKIVTLDYIAKPYTAEFETSYGGFKVRKENEPNALEVEIDYSFLGGLYNTDTSGNFINRDCTFEISYEYGDGTTAIAPVQITTSAQDNSPIRETIKHTLPTDANNRSIFARLIRITSEPTDITSMDKIHIRSVKKIYETPNYEPLGDITLLWCKVRASNAISSIGQFAINAWVTRTDKNNDVKSVLTDLYTNEIYGGRLPSTELDFDNTPDSLVNGAIDSRITLYDAMDMVAKSNRYSLYPVGGELKIKLDEAKPIRTALFNETNIIKDSLKISYLFTEENDTDSYKITYRDEDDFSEQFEIYPIDGDFPVTNELWGCTNTSIANSAAMYLYKQEKSRRKTVEFKTDIQGLIPQYLDRIAISHDLPRWGVGGQISSFVGRVINLTCNYGKVHLDTWDCDEVKDCIDPFFTMCESDYYDTIVFRNSNGDVSDTYSFTIIGDGQIELAIDGPTWLYQGEDYDKTYFSIGQVDTIVKDYIVTSIKPNGKEVTITGVNYDESIYS